MSRSVAKYAPTDMKATTPTCFNRSHDRIDTAAVMANDSSGSSMTYLNSDDVGAGSVEGSDLMLLAGAAVPFSPESSAVVASEDLTGEDLTAARVVAGMLRRAGWKAGAVVKVTRATEAQSERNQRGVRRLSHHIVGTAEHCVNRTEPQQPVPQRRKSTGQTVEGRKITSCQQWQCRAAAASEFATSALRKWNCYGNLS